MKKYDPNEIYLDDSDVVYGVDTIGYCITKNGYFTGDISFNPDIDERLKQAVISKLNNSFYKKYIGHEWREIVEESTKLKIENRLAESFEKIVKDLQKDGLLTEAKSFDLDFNGKGINIKLN